MQDSAMLWIATHRFTVHLSESQTFNRHASKPPFEEWQRRHANPASAHVFARGDDSINSGHQKKRSSSDDLPGNLRTYVPRATKHEAKRHNRHKASQLITGNGLCRTVLEASCLLNQSCAEKIGVAVDKAWSGLCQATATAPVVVCPRATVGRVNICVAHSRAPKTASTITAIFS